MFEDVAVELKGKVDASTLLKDALKPRRRGPWRVYHPTPILLPDDGTVVIVAERFDVEEHEVLGQVAVQHIGFGLAGWICYVRGVALQPGLDETRDASGRAWAEFIEIGQALVDRALGPDE